MKHAYGEPVKIIFAGGREFRLYREYDELLKEEILKYPDFEENPEYTDEGRPFVTSAQESCPHGKYGDPDDDIPCDCGGCAFFRREHLSHDAVGVCMCDMLLHEVH